MTPQERTITETLSQITELKERIELEPENRKLRRELKELQYLQLWQLEKMENEKSR